ncbi:MAG: hypothetical protein LBK66_07525 [Spirochaetaceae bacterium]|jgi:hypothetical protein|nr:hypothetical protein [Spirochaetaceae bacterium]
MKTITQIIAGAQALLNISFELKNCFEEYLSDEYKGYTVELMNLNTLKTARCLIVKSVFQSNPRR